MAGDWIPVRVNLCLHTKVLRIARATGQSPFEVVGRLVRFWSWAQSETPDGRLARLTVDDLVTAVGADITFWNAVIDVGWLEVCEDGLALPGAEWWLGVGAKARMSKNMRQKRWRQNKQERVDARVDASVGAREEKRREENNTPQPPLEGGAGEEVQGSTHTRKKGKVEPAEGFDQFWAAYPKKQAKQDAIKAWNKLNPDAELRATLLRSLAVKKRDEDWLKEQGRYIPLPATWLNGRRWEDEGVKPEAEPEEAIEDRLARQRVTLEAQQREREAARQRAGQNGSFCRTQPGGKGDS